MTMSVKDVEGIHEVIKTGRPYLKVHNCRYCGNCVSTWPHGHRCSLSTRLRGVQVNSRGMNEIIANIKEGRVSISDGLVDLLFRCVSCNVCIQNCSEAVETRKYIQALRKELVERGIVPKSLMAVLKSEAQNGNVWGKPKNRRMDWAEGLNVRVASETKDFEYLLFVGDSSAYVPKNQTTARLFTEILSRLGISFAVLGNEERSSGNEALRIGEEGLFEELAGTNIANFRTYGVKKIIALSPHGFHALKNEYPALDPEFQCEVQHYTQFLHELLRQDRLKFTNEIRKKVTYHDSCYLGRHNEIFEEPREILRAIPGLQLVEMEQVDINAVCCGGGGGGIWMERGDGVRVDEIRFGQAVETGADVLATACPLCAQQFEAVNENSQERPLQVQDIVELVYEAM